MTSEVKMQPCSLTGKKGSSSDVSLNQKLSLTSNCKRKGILKFKCIYCDQTLSTRYCLKRHLRSVHSIQNSEVFLPLTAMKKHQCPLCDLASSKTDLISHFQTDHNLCMDIEQLTFDSFHSFKIWKENIEKDSITSFVMQKTKVTDDIKSYYFVCNRSGSYENSGKGIRHLKKQGSVKINAYCPASIKVLELAQEKCNVSYQKVHVGHKKDLCHMRLSTAEREQLAVKIASKIPFDVILDEVRDSILSGGVERLHLLTKRDLHNIQRSYNLYPESVKHADDQKSINAWVKDMQDSGCVLHYNPQDLNSEIQHELKSTTLKVNTTEEKVIVKYNDDQYHLKIENIISKYKPIKKKNDSPKETYIEESETTGSYDIGQSQSETTGMNHNNGHSLEVETEGCHNNIGRSQESETTGSARNIGQSQESETTGSNHNIGQSQERTTIRSNRKNFWKNPTSRKRSFLEISSLEKVIDKLCKKSKENNVNENEFDYFGKSISVQLKNMPLDRALICQEKLQKVMTEERLNQHSKNHQLLPSQQSSSEAITQILFPANYIQGANIMMLG